MTQRKISSYLPIIYIFSVLLCISIIHLSEVIGAYNHRVEMKNLDLKQKKNAKNKPKKRVKKKVMEAQKQPVDTVSLVLSEPEPVSDSVVEESTTVGDEEFFLDLIEDYYNKRKNSKGRISRTDIVIRYYKKEKDGDRVYQLRDLGFYIHERPAEEEFDGYASNAIFYGDSVRKEDLILIAYNMMQNGVNLQSLTLSKFHDAWKAHSVEIGTDTTALNKAPFTLATLRNKWKDM